jgi:hypothetical protein
VYECEIPSGIALRNKRRKRARDQNLNVSLSIVVSPVVSRSVASFVTSTELSSGHPQVQLETIAVMFDNLAGTASRQLQLARRGCPRSRL